MSDERHPTAADLHSEHVDLLFADAERLAVLNHGEQRRLARGLSRAIAAYAAAETERDALARELTQKLAKIQILATDAFDNMQGVDFPAAQDVLTLVKSERGYRRIAAEQGERANALAAQCAALREALDEDLNVMAAALIQIRDTLRGASWLTSSRGPYAWDDDRYQREAHDIIFPLLDVAEKAIPRPAKAYAALASPTEAADALLARVRDEATRAERERVAALALRIEDEQRNLAEQNKQRGNSSSYWACIERALGASLVGYELRKFADELATEPTT